MLSSLVHGSGMRGGFLGPKDTLHLVEPGQGHLVKS